MKIQDYAHLYYGCSCLFRYKNSKEWNAGTIREISLQRLHNGNTYELKPILRPLSSMTEEEFDEVVSHIAEDGEKPSEDFANIETYIWHLGEYLNPADLFELTRKLLSKHFDLFGLIEAGLAIDATKLNSQQEVKANDEKRAKS